MAKCFLLTATATLAYAFTQPTTQCPGDCNPIYHPGLQETVFAGAPFNVQWKPTTPGTVTLVLYNGPGNNLKLVGPIVEHIANSGNFTWTPDLSLIPDVTHYGLQIINDLDGTYQYSTQFGINNPLNSGGVEASTSIVFPTTTVSNNTYPSPSGSASMPAPGITTTATTSTSSTIVSSPQSTSKSDTTTSSVSSNKTTSATPPKNSSGAERLGLNVGGAFIALIGAFFTL